MKKKCILILAIICSFTGFSQIKIFVNGSEIKDDAIVSLSSIETMEISFVPTYKVDTYSNGYGYFSIQHYSSSNEKMWNNFDMLFEGMSASENWMSVEKKHLIYNKARNNGEFSGIGLIYTVWDNAKYTRTTNLIGLTIYAGYRDKIGYEEYGSPVELAPPFSFKINTAEDPSKLSTTLSNAYLNPVKAQELKIEKSVKLHNGPSQDDVFNEPEQYFTSFKREDKVDYFMKALVLNPTIGSDEQIDVIKTELIKEAIYNTKKRKSGNAILDNSIIGKFKSEATNESKTSQWGYFTLNPILSESLLKSKKESEQSGLYEDIQLGQLKGIRLLFSYNIDGEKSYSSFYLFKDPSNSNQVIMFCGNHDSYTTNETFNAQVQYQERVIAALQF